LFFILLQGRMTDRSSVIICCAMLPCCAGGAWETAHCALNAFQSECTHGRFEGGSVGKTYPDCYWNATVKLPVVETAAIRCVSADKNGACASQSLSFRSF
jgi:hypothetical protein